MGIRIKIKKKKKNDSCIIFKKFLYCCEKLKFGWYFLFALRI